MSIVVCIRGGGDLGSGAVVRLFRCGMKVVVSELPAPLVVRRTVAFAEAIFSGSISIEGIVGKRVANLTEVENAIAEGVIPVLVDSDLEFIRALNPDVVVDARLLKQPLGEGFSAHPMLIGLGPGFIAGVNCHAVVETKRGHTLGRVIWEGSGEPNSGTPENVMGFEEERVLRAPADGVFQGKVKIGARVVHGDTLAEVGEASIKAPFSGILRGIVATGVKVTAGMKVGDVDPRPDDHLFDLVSDKALAVGGGVLEAILTNVTLRNKL